MALTNAEKQARFREKKRLAAANEKGHPAVIPSPVLMQSLEILQACSRGKDLVRRMSQLETLKETTPLVQRLVKPRCPPLAEGSSVWDNLASGLPSRRGR